MGGGQGCCLPSADTGRPTGHIQRPTVTSAKMRGAALGPSVGLACAGLAFVLTKAPVFPGNLFVPFCLLACLSKHRIKSRSVNCTNAEWQLPEPTFAVCAATWNYAPTARLTGARGSPPTSTPGLAVIGDTQGQALLC